MEFVEAPAFTEHVSDYLTDAELRRLQLRLFEDAEAGDVMPGTGGFRKLRWSDPRRGKGRRGGLRVILLLLPEDRQVWLLTVYDKDEASDLTAEQKRALKRAIEAEKVARARVRARRVRWKR